MLSERVFMLSQRSFMLSQRVFMLSQRSFMLSQRVFMLSQRSFMLSERVFMLSRLNKNECTASGNRNVIKLHFGLSIFIFCTN
jgi:hypothetical protein